MWPFRRKPKGKHALGAAVTGIPGLPPAVVPSYVAPVAPLPPCVPWSAEQVARPATPSEPAGPLPQVMSVAPGGVRRVELGFRDGSVAALSPESEQAKALTDIAFLLTHRD